jgi:hypothetical protein
MEYQEFPDNFSLLRSSTILPAIAETCTIEIKFHS